MPKVSADYVSQKRNSILDAALSVCLKKPMHEVSMRDIISENGLSQGNIYRYFSNIDDIVIGLINREIVLHDTKAMVDAAILSDNAPEKIIGELFSIWGKAVLDSLVGVGKVYYEICAVYVNDKARLNRFISETCISSEEAYLQEKAYSFIEFKISEGYFNPKLPIDAIFTFLITCLDGIIRDLIITQHYRIDSSPFPDALEKNKLIKSLSTAFILLLGGNENLL